jgi:DNA-binding NarL/FixJ family response regulator
MIQIAIVDDKPQNLVSLRDKIADEQDIEVLFTASNGQEFLKKLELNSHTLPQVVLMDIDMPILNGIETVKKAKATFASIHYLMLTVFDDDAKIFEAIQAGAVGYLLKDESVEAIKNAVVQTVEAGASPMSPGIARKALNLLMNAKVSIKTSPESNLTEREMEILQGLVQGLDYKEVANNLFISPHTVRSHIARIYEKLQVKNKAQAVGIAVKNKWFMF